MKSKVFLSILILLLLTVPQSANTITFGGSNLGVFGYPSHECGFRPSKPYKPYSLSSQWEVDSYNARVRAYNSDIEQYTTCINEYLDNCRNDINRIKDRMQEALNEANR